MKKEDIENKLRARGYRDRTPLDISTIAETIASFEEEPVEETEGYDIAILHASGEEIRLKVSDELILSEVISISHDNPESALFVNNTLVYQGSVRDKELEIYYEYKNL